MSAELEYNVAVDVFVYLSFSLNARVLFFDATYRRWLVSELQKINATIMIRFLRSTQEPEERDICTGAEELERGGGGLTSYFFS